MANQTSHKKAAERSNPRVIVSTDACPVCGTLMREKHGKLKFPVNGENIMVAQAAHLACSKCGEIVLRLEDARHLRQQAFAMYRKKYRLLSTDEILALRERFGLTQAAIAHLLRLGTNTISRWEAGRNVQTTAMDVLLRLLRDVPGSLEYLQKHAA